MADRHIVCYEAMPLPELRAAALRRADEVEAHDGELYWALLHLGWGVDGDDVDEGDIDLLRRRPDIASWSRVDTGAVVTLAGVDVRVGRQA